MLYLPKADPPGSRISNMKMLCFVHLVTIRGYTLHGHVIMMNPSERHFRRRAITNVGRTCGPTPLLPLYAIKYVYTI